MNPPTVLVISPQPWDHIPVSKHNYSIALARRGHNVVFLNPPADSTAAASACDIVPECPGLRVLSYRRPWFYNLRFHAPVVFDWLMNRHVTKLLQSHQCVPDLVWSFDCNLFLDLSVFRATQTIFHPVDPLSELRHAMPARTADLVLTVSSRIADQIPRAQKMVHVVPHGLAAPFEQLAREQLERLKIQDGNDKHDAADKTVHVGYAGNLARRPVNRAVLRQIVAENSGIQFHFWGPDKCDSDPAAGFIAFLRQQSNVTLHGAVSQVQLAAGFRDMDAFLLSYLPDPVESDRSNSHKILEYLSSGKVVVSSRLQAYEEQPDLLVMSQTEDDRDLAQLFSGVIDRLRTLNTVNLQQQRISFALQNTYDRHIERIFQLLDDLRT